MDYWIFEHTINGTSVFPQRETFQKKTQEHDIKLIGLWIFEHTINGTSLFPQRETFQKKLKSKIRKLIGLLDL